MPPVANPNPDRAVRPRPPGAAEQELVIAPAVGAAAAPIANAVVPQAVATQAPAAAGCFGLMPVRKTGIMQLQTDRKRTAAAMRRGRRRWQFERGHPAAPDGVRGAPPSRTCAPACPRLHALMRATSAARLFAPASPARPCAPATPAAGRREFVLRLYPSSVAVLVLNEM